MDLRYIVFDTETTGVGKDKQAVEIAMVEIDSNMVVQGEASSLIKPTCPISPEAEAVHGISMDMLKDCPTIEEWVRDILGGRLEGDIVLIGHRIGFDRPLFAPIGDAKFALDTLVLAQTYVPESPNKKLDTLKEFLSLPGGGESHRAMADVTTCLQLLQHIVPMTGRTLEVLSTVPYTVIHRMPWGKHEGKLLLELPEDYRRWLLKLEDLDHNLRRSLELVAAADVPLNVGRSSGTARRIFIPKRTLK